MAAYGLPVAFDNCCLSARLHGLLYARPSCWHFYLTPRESISQKLNRDKEHLESLAGRSRPAQLERRKSAKNFSTRSLCYSLRCSPPLVRENVKYGNFDASSSERLFNSTARHRAPEVGLRRHRQRGQRALRPETAM